MNIEEYRAMKKQEQEEAQQKEQSHAQTQQTADGNVSTTQTQTEQVSNEPPEETKQEETKPDEKPSKTDADETSTKTDLNTVEIDGKTYTLDELKSGFMRQSDYTRKTQEVKRKEQQAQEAIKFMEQLQQNPKIAEQLSEQFDVPNLDPRQAQYTEMENKYYDLLIEKQISDLEKKYGEFDVEEVLSTARDNNINDLDTAYHVVQSRKGGGGKSQPDVNVDELKESLRDELLKELKAEKEAQVDTSTIIKPGGGKVPEVKEPQLSQQELKVARMMGMNKEEYAKWRDAGKKRK